jgi:hypothetical protein
MARHCHHCGRKTQRRRRGIGAFLILCLLLAAFIGGISINGFTPRESVESTQGIRSQLTAAQAKLQDAANADAEHVRQINDLRQQLADAPPAPGEMEHVLADLRRQAAAAQAVASNAESERVDARKHQAVAEAANGQLLADMKAMREALASAKGIKAAEEAYARFVPPGVNGHAMPEVREQVVGDQALGVGPSASRARWEALGMAVKRGDDHLTQSTVEKELGRPDRIYEVGTSVVIWSYTPHNFPGQVTFVRGTAHTVLVPRDADP